MPRTVLGLLVGPALGLAGALMQAVTRNPLADPGLLGVNAGAATAVVLAVSTLGVSGPSGYIWFALAGAALAATAVYLLGSRGHGAATPVRLALAGTAVSAALYAVINAMILLDQQSLDAYRFWAVGALTGRDLSVAAELGPFLAVGVLLALSLGRPLNALGLGDDAGRALGATPAHTRVLAVTALTLLCGAATAAVGPITFVGLTVPHVARALIGPDQRWVLAYSAVLAPILLIVADTAGRVIARPGEIQVGIMTALIGAPVFIGLVRRRRIAAA